MMQQLPVKKEVKFSLDCGGQEPGSSSAETMLTPFLFLVNSLVGIK